MKVAGAGGPERSMCWPGSPPGPGLLGGAMGPCWQEVPGEWMDTGVGPQGRGENKDKGEKGMGPYGKWAGLERRGRFKLRQRQENEGGSHFPQAQVWKRGCVLGREEGQ